MEAGLVGSKKSRARGVLGLAGLGSGTVLGISPSSSSSELLRDIAFIKDDYKQPDHSLELNVN
jgi:hypothetical protein